MSQHTDFIADLEGLLEDAEEKGNLTSEQVISAVRSLIWEYREPQGDCCG